MNTEAKLRVLFDRYSISSKSTKSFINYFMNNAEFAIACDQFRYTRQDIIDSITSHTDNHYEFIINDRVNGAYASANHEADETFNFNINAIINYTTEVYENYNYRLSLSASNGNVVMKYYRRSEALGLTIDYKVNKSKWTPEKLAELFPDGIPDTIDPNNLKDFEPLLINEDLIDDTYITPVRKVKEFFVLSGDSFDVEDLGDNTIVMEFTGGRSPIVEDNNVAVLFGSLSNSETGETLSLDNMITHLTKVDENSYSLVIDSDKEFDTADINLYSMYKEQGHTVYGAIAQKYHSYVSGYEIQIPIQNDNQYKVKNDTIWYATGDKDCTVGFNFSNLKLGNQDTDSVRLEFEKLDSYANGTLEIAPERFTVRYIATGEHGNDFLLKLYCVASSGAIFGTLYVKVYDTSISDSEPVLSASTEVQMDAEGYGVLRANTFNNLVDSTDSTKVMTDYVVANGTLRLYAARYSSLGRAYNMQLSGGTLPRADIRFYLNDVLRAKAIDGKTFTSIFGDRSWPGSLALVTFNRDRASTGKVRMVLYGEDGETIISNNASFYELAEIFNFKGAVGHFYLDLSTKNKIVYNFRRMDQFLVTDYDTCALAMSDKPTENLTSGIHIFNTRYECDRGRSILEKSAKDVSIPAKVKIISVDGRDITDAYPYYAGITDAYPYYTSISSLSISKPKGKIEYSHRTPTFTITTPDGEDGFDIFNAQYRIGFYALDGSDKSSEELAKSFVDKACFTVSYRNVYGSTDYRYGQSFNIIPRQEHMNDDTFYSVSNMFLHQDKSSPIIMSPDSSVHYSICRTALLPIIEMSSDRSTETLRGLMYMDLYNVDDNTRIERDWNGSTSLDRQVAITVNGEDAFGTEILIEKIK